MKAKQIVSILLFTSMFVFACNKTNQTTNNTDKQNSDKQNTSQNTKVVTYEFKCSGMHCSGCEETITEKVKEIDGVTEVKADSKTNTAKVTFDDKKTNTSAIEEAIVKSGYKVVSSKQI